LIAKGHKVTIISHNADKQLQIEALGAKAAIGSVEDAAFLKIAFEGADAAYCMSPPNFTAKCIRYRCFVIKRFHQAGMHRHTYCITHCLVLYFIQAQLA